MEIGASHFAWTSQKYEKTKAMETLWFFHFACGIFSLREQFGPYDRFFLWSKLTTTSSNPRHTVSQTVSTRNFDHYMVSTPLGYFSSFQSK